MKKLLAAQPDLVNQIDPWEKYPLTNATRWGETAAMQLLLAAGTEVNAVGKHGTALHQIAGDHDNTKKPLQVLKILLDAGADVHVRNYRNCTPLHLAVTGRTKVDLEIVNVLIAAGSDVNTADNFNRTMVMAASGQGSPSIVKALLAGGANVNAVCSRGTPLTFAAEKNRADNAAVLRKTEPTPIFASPPTSKVPTLPVRPSWTWRQKGQEGHCSAARKGRSACQEGPGCRGCCCGELAENRGLASSAQCRSRTALRPPAVDADLAAVETVIGNKLPSDFKEAWKIHNGNGDTKGSLLPPLDAAGDMYGNSQTPGGYYLMPCKELIQEWQNWKGLVDSGEFADTPSGPDKGIQDSWWHPGWIPFASNGGGDSICLDLRRPRTARSVRSSR